MSKIFLIFFEILVNQTQASPIPVKIQPDWYQIDICSDKFDIWAKTFSH